MKSARFSSLLLCIALVLIATVTTAEQAPAPQFDKRLSIYTLLREDMFAGILDHDVERLANAEKNIDILLVQRPKDKAGLLALKSFSAFFHAVQGLEAGRQKEFDDNYKQAQQLLSEAKKVGSKDLGVSAVTAGMNSIFADRLPEKLRGAAWETAYKEYQALWKAQSQIVKSLPLHLKGELLGGLAESAQRTGHDKEFAEYLDKLIEYVPNSAYARAAKEWKDDPMTAKGTRMTCLSCHNAGRLAARRAALDAQKKK